MSGHKCQNCNGYGNIGIMACLDCRGTGYWRPATGDVACPFCGQCNFDLIGLKGHLQRGWCEEFNECGSSAGDTEQ